jgi:hypothetical protein
MKSLISIILVGIVNGVIAELIAMTTVLVLIKMFVTFIVVQVSFPSCKFDIEVGVSELHWRRIMNNRVLQLHAVEGKMSWFELVTDATIVVIKVDFIEFGMSKICELPVVIEAPTLTNPKLCTICAIYYNVLQLYRYAP